MKSFRTPESFRAWLAKYHASRKELVVRLYKVHATSKGIGYAEALDEALCVGWIDGVRKSYDADTFTVRFTPRKAKSVWSKVNIRHMARLLQEGRVEPPGRAAYERRDRKGSDYSYASFALELDAASEKAFKSNKAAWTFFTSQAPWYQRLTKYRVMKAKRPETRAARLARLINDSAHGRRIREAGGKETT
ncbi:MAG TPA: YdeI/OmpD-associated family protein [Gemmatimonadales bacterium]